MGLGLQLLGGGYVGGLAEEDDFGLFEVAACVCGGIGQLGVYLGYKAEIREFW